MFRQTLQTGVAYRHGVPRAAALTAAFVVVVLAGCGGASVDRSPETAADWAQSVCVVVTDWRDSVRAVGDELAEGDALTTDSLKDAAQEVEDANDTLTEELGRIDAPDTGAVSEAQEAVSDLSDEIEERRGEVEDAIDEATDNPSLSSVFDAISIVTAALRDTAGDVRDALEDVERAGGDAADAVREAPACRDLAGQDEPAGS